jgi:hypothetical protein
VGKQDANEHIKKLKDEALVERSVDSIIGKLLLNNESATKADFTGDTLLVRDIIIKYIYEGILEYDSSRKEFKIVGLEKDVDCKYPISNNRFVNLSGRADRIDELSDGTLQIIDYKSGNRPHLECSSIESLFTGAPIERISNIFQTLLYSMMLQRKHNTESCPSLYYASKMFSEEYSPLIVDKSTDKYIERYSHVATEFENHLDIALEELFNPDIPFTQVEDVDACNYCDYKKICRR